VGSINPTTKPEGKKPFGILRRRWEDNIRMDLRDIGWKGLDWMYEGHTESNEHTYPTMKRRYTYKNK
jgi:hypothetical protein